MMNCTKDGQELLLSQLPKAEGWLKSGVYLYKGFWYPSKRLHNIVRFQQHFQAHNEDIILASCPKSDTTWLKALMFSIVNRVHDDLLPNTSLLTTNPHQLVPFFEFTLYANAAPPDLSSIPSPRLFSTHIPYTSLPKSVTHSKCRIVYICRNPLDVLVSFWHFSKRWPEWSSESPTSMEEYVKKLCEGEHAYGPLWSQILGFWTKSLEKPEKVLFLKYEDIKEDPVPQMERLAEFLGFPFSEVEKSKGVIEKILEMCSLNNLKGLEVNKNGKFIPDIENASHFRKGEVGDWVNHLSPTMVGSIEKVFKKKLAGSGLTFKTSI